MTLMLINKCSFSEDFSEKMIQKAHGALLAHLSSHYNQVALTPISRVKNSHKKIDDFQVSFQTAHPVAKRVCVWLTQGDERIAIWFSVTAFSSIPVAKHDLNAQSMVMNNDFVWVEKNIAGLSQPPAENLPERFWLKNAMTHGQILFQKQVEAPPLIRRGQHVKVQIYENNVMLNLDAVAETHGYSGEMVLLKNPANNKTLTARVSGIQQAEIR